MLCNLLLELREGNGESQYHHFFSHEQMATLSLTLPWVHLAASYWVRSIHQALKQVQIQCEQTHVHSLFPRTCPPCPEMTSIHENLWLTAKKRIHISNLPSQAETRMVSLDSTYIIRTSKTHLSVSEMLMPKEKIKYLQKFIIRNFSWLYFHHSAV